MKLRKILASASACAIAACAMAVTASAKITNASPNSEKGDGYTSDCKSLDYNNIYGIKAEITFAGAVTDDTKGGLAFNADDKKGTGWTQYLWQLDASGKKVDAGTDKGVTIEDKGNGKYVLSVIADKAYLADCADWDWAEVYVGSWGGTDFKVDSLVALDKDGKEVGAKAADSSAPATTAASEASTTAAGTTSAAASSSAASSAAATTKASTAANAGAAKTTAGTKKEDATKAGDSGVALAVAGLTAGAAAMYLARKKH